MTQPIGTLVPPDSDANLETIATPSGDELIAVSDGGDWKKISLSTVATLSVGSGVTDHGALTGKSDDDHTQYHNDTRGDTRYYTRASLDAGQLDGRYYTETEADAAFAPIANGVTNGDSHDHSGGDGGTIAYASLSGAPTLGTASAADLLDEDDLVSDSNTDAASQQSVKAYIDAQVIGAGSGDVVGPGSAVDDRIVTFSGTTGKLIQDSGTLIAGLATSAQGALADSATQPGDLGTAATLNVGVAVADVVQVADVGGGTPGLPALDGSLLLGLSTSGGVAPQPIHTTTAALSLVTNSIIACTAVPSTTTLPETGSDSRVVVLNRTASAITVARKTAYTIRNGATGGLTTIDIPAYSQGDFHVENSETEWNVQLTETGGEANITAAVGSGTYSVLATTPKTGSTLQFKKLDAGTNVSITDSSDILTIDTGANVITAAAVITDNRIVRGDGGAKGVQDTPIAVSDHTQVLTIDVTALSTGRTLTFSDENLDLSAIPQANVAGLTASSSPQFTAVNINHATDTTITRVSAGVIAVEGKTVATVEDVRTNVPAVDSGASRTMAIASDLGSAGAQECFLRLSHASAQYDVVKNIAAVGQRFMVQWTNATPSQATPFTNTGGSCTFVPSSLPTVDTQYQSLCLLCVDATTDANVFHVLPSTL